MTSYTIIIPTFLLKYNRLLENETEIFEKLNMHNPRFQCKKRVVHELVDYFERVNSLLRTMATIAAVAIGEPNKY